MPATTSSPGPAAQDQHLLAGSMARAARTFQAEADTSAILDELTAMAVSLVPGTQDAAVSVVAGRADPATDHRTGELGRLLDAFQAETGEGPGVDALRSRRSVRVADMSADQRWPSFARRAHALGVSSLASFPLHVRDRSLGVLHVASPAVGAFDDESDQIGLLLAGYAAIALANTRAREQLVHAVDSRDLIGQAKGILMQRYHLDQQRAFSVLVRASQATHRKLHDVAHELVTTGRLATVPATP